MDPVNIDPAELLALCAIDDDLYARTFFPKTARQASPEFHKSIDAALMPRANRFVAIEVFRGGAKTSKLRLFTSKRIAYGVSHTILFVSNSQAHSVKSIEWLKRNVEHNHKWANMFGLRPGNRWAAEDIEIIHGVDAYPIRVIAAGITGQIRGVNIDDFRPDLIIVDDPDNEETTATEEQRKKTSNLFFGALAKSLAPPSDAPDAKMVLLQTPLNRFDLIETCMRDPQWHGLRFSCFDSKGQSAWPERFSTDDLMADKQAHINRNQLALWMREMECTIVSEETSSFRQEWLQYYTTLPEGCWYLIAIDPASSDSPNADYFAIVVLAIKGPDVYIVEYSLARGVDSDAAIAYIIDLAVKYRPRKAVCEIVGFQRTLERGLRKEMDRRRVFTPVQPFQSKQRKSYRIVQAVSARASYKHLYCRTEHVEFIQQFIGYSPLFEDHDDLIDAVAMGLDAISNELDVIEGDYYTVNDKAIPDLDWRNAP